MYELTHFQYKLDLRFMKKQTNNHVSLHSIDFDHGKKFKSQQLFPLSIHLRKTSGSDSAQCIKKLSAQARPPKLGPHQERRGELSPHSYPPTSTQTPIHCHMCEHMCVHTENNNTINTCTLIF